MKVLPVHQEVFTGAMRPQKAKVYGSKTFGKGIVQTTREFKDGSLLKYTQMKWLTPDGHIFMGKVYNLIQK